MIKKVGNKYLNRIAGSGTFSCNGILLYTIINFDNGGLIPNTVKVSIDNKTNISFNLSSTSLPVFVFNEDYVFIQSFYTDNEIADYTCFIADSSFGGSTSASYNYDFKIFKNTLGNYSYYDNSPISVRNNCYNSFLNSSLCNIENEISITISQPSNRHDAQTLVLTDEPMTFS